MPEISLEEVLTQQLDTQESNPGSLCYWKILSHS